MVPLAGLPLHIISKVRNTQVSLPLRPSPCTDSGMAQQINQQQETSGRQLASHEMNMQSNPHPSVVVALADTEASRRLHHRLRYQVYCQELGYEDPERFPDGEERDGFDDGAVHFVAYDGWRQDWAGTLRLIPPTHIGLPLLSVADLTPDVMRLVEQQQVGELSRMCVRARTLPTLTTGRPTADGPPSRDSALVFFALIRASVDYAFQHRISHLVYLATSSLVRLLGRLGINDHAAGEGCHHRGRRYPRILDVAALHRTLFDSSTGHPYSAKLSPASYRPYSALPAALHAEPALLAYG